MSKKRIFTIEVWDEMHQRWLRYGSKAYESDSYALRVAAKLANETGKEYHIKGWKDAAE